MTSDLAAALARYWPLLISLILKVSGQVAAPGAWTRARQAKLFARLRGAEALARRWLMLKSTPCFRAASAQRCTTGAVSRVCPAAPRPERAPLLRFLERDPALRAADFSGQPFTPAAAPASNGPPVDTALEGPSAGLLRRTEALLDVLRRPDHHAARMTRWLRRAAARRGFVRRHPLRVGRPPGAISGRRARRSSELQPALWWLDRLAREEFAPACAGVTQRARSSDMVGKAAPPPPPAFAGVP
ncbi:MAG: hypothetical protein AAFR51_09320 [Pseudomonadota bacterium]